MIIASESLRRVSRFAAGLSAYGLAGLCALTAVGSVADWAEPGFERRARVPLDIKTGGSVLVPLPDFAAIGSMPRGRDANGRQVPLERALKTAGGLWVRMGAQDAEGKPFAGPLNLYFDGPEDQEADSGPLPADPTPWALEVFRITGVGIPDTWERMAFMRRQASAAESRFLAAGFDDFDWSQIPGRRALLEAGTYLKISRPGSYRFALHCRQAAFLLIDGQPVCAFTGEGDSGGWVIGDPVKLEPGIYCLTILNYHVRGRDHRLQAGWVIEREGEPPEPTPIPASHLPAAVAVEPSLIETSGQPINPGFRYDIQPAYRVESAEPTFVPVRFQSVSTGSKGLGLSFRWFFGDGAESTGARATHVYTGPGVYNVRLEVRDADGRLAEVSRLVKAMPFRLHEARLEAFVSGLPPALYGRDRVNPVLSIKGDFQNRLLEIEWRINLREGSEIVSSTNGVPSGARTLTIPLASNIEADAVRNLSWSITHAGATLMEGVLIFMRPPFESRPELLAADRLLAADGSRMIWVTDRVPARRRPTVGDGARPSVPAVWLTDIPAFLPDCPALTVQPLRSWERAPDVAGPLVKFLDVRDVLMSVPRDLVLGIGCLDALKGLDVESFERQIAVLTDWTLAREGGRVFWSTPPPLLEPPEAMRPYAAAVRRVADARGVPVVDLYSYFRGSTTEEAWIQAPPLMGLTTAGGDAARSLIIEALQSLRPRQ